MPTQFSFGHASPLPLSTGAGGPSLATQRHRGSYRDGWMSQWIRQRLYEVRLILRWLSPDNSLPGRETNTGDKGPARKWERQSPRTWLEAFVSQCAWVSLCFTP